jgi:DNA-binding IclR family transcriptional regulator
MSNVKSAARALQLLELFDRVQMPLTLREIVQITGIPQSSASALLNTLINLSYIAHDRRTYEYAPTAQVSHLGKWIGDDGVGSDPFVSDAVTRLNLMTGETAVAAVRRGTYARYVLVKQEKRPTVVPTVAGVLRPVCTSGTGLALLSKLDNIELKKVVNQAQRERRGLIKKSSLKAVRDQIEHLNKHGFVMSRSGVFEGTGMIATVLPNPVNGDFVALAVGGPLNRLDAKMSTIVQQLRLSIKAFE